MPSSTLNQETTADQAVEHYAADVKGKNAVVIGASPGSTGFEAAKAIAKQLGDGTLVLAGRFIEKLNAAKEDILKEAPSAKVVNVVVDLNSLAAVRKAAKEFEKLNLKFDVVFNSAAGLGREQIEFTEDGFETQFGVGALSYFLLINLLHKAGTFTPDTRIISISSIAAGMTTGEIGNETYDGGKKYSKMAAYAWSKAANVLFTNALAKRGIHSFSLHPGVILSTPLYDTLMSKEDKIAFGIEDADGNLLHTNHYLKTPAQGASTYIVAGYDKDLLKHDGGYLADCQLQEPLSPYLADPKNAEAFWARCNELVGESF